MSAQGTQENPIVLDEVDTPHRVRHASIREKIRALMAKMETTEWKGMTSAEREQDLDAYAFWMIRSGEWNIMQYHSWMVKLRD